MNILWTRRRFLQTAAVGTAAATLAPGLLSGIRVARASDARSRVVLAHHARLADSGGAINRKIVQDVLEDTLMAFTETSSVQDAWLRIFPDLQTSDTIGLKVNCINRRLSSHPEVAYAITDSLIAALDVNPNHLIIWDRTSRELRRAGYDLNIDAAGVRCLGTSDDIGYDDEAAVDLGNGRTVHLSKVITQMCTYLINVPVLKDHGIAGVTLSLKNHYGSIDRPAAGHRNGGDPAIANLNTTPQIREKTRLIVCDGLLGIYQGGPHGAPQWVNRQVLVSADPVAVDTIGAGIIDRERQAHGLPAASVRAGYLQTAAALRVGATAPDRIEAMPIDLG